MISKSRTFTLSGATLLRLFGFVLALLGCQFSFAQSGSPDADVEEILVTGERSLRSLRIEVEMAQEAAFDVFNEIYAGTDYEMICTRERPVKDAMDPIPNSWTVRACRSRKAQELHEQQMEDFGEYISAEENGEIGILADTAGFIERTDEHREELYERARDLILESPEYREKLIAYTSAKETYEAAVEADYAKGNVFSQFFGWITNSDD